MKEQEYKKKIEELEEKLNQQQEDIDKIKKVLKKQKWWNVYFAWKD